MERYCLRLSNRQNREVDSPPVFQYQSAGIEMQGEKEIQQLINIHFSSPRLAKALALRSAMLYFVYNQVMVVVDIDEAPLQMQLLTFCAFACDSCGGRM